MKSASLLKTVITNTVPDVPVWILFGMVVCGIAGSEIGSRIHKKINDRVNTGLLEGAMVLVAIISVYNMTRML